MNTNLNADLFDGHQSTDFLRLSTGGIVTAPITVTAQISSTYNSGAPFAVTSTTVNTNLNADRVDGHHSTDFASATSLASYLPLAGGTLTGALSSGGHGIYADGGSLCLGTPRRVCATSTVGHWLMNSAPDVTMWDVSSSGGTLSGPLSMDLPGSSAGTVTFYDGATLTTTNNGTIYLIPNGTGTISVRSNITNSTGPVKSGAASTPSAGYADVNDWSHGGDLYIAGKALATGTFSAGSYTSTTAGSGYALNTQAWFEYSYATPQLATHSSNSYNVMLFGNYLNLHGKDVSFFNVTRTNPHFYILSNVVPTAATARWGYFLHSGDAWNAGQFQIMTGSGPVVVGTYTPSDGNSDIGDLAVQGDIQAGATINAVGGYKKGTATGVSNTTSYWLCTAADCSTKCQVTITGGLITGCP